MMNRLILWFSRRRLFTFCCLVAYLISVCLGHKVVSDFFDWMRDVLSFPVYNSLLLATAAVLFLIFSLVLFNRIWRDKTRRVARMAWFFLTAALAVGAYEVLIVFSIETIHFIQYALPALPVFALTMNFGETVGWVTLMGALDEAYQYFVIYANYKTVYFDFNDIMLNLVGAGIGVLAIYTLSDLNAPPFSGKERTAVRSSRHFLSPSRALTISVIAMGFVLHLAGIIEPYHEASASSAPIVLSRKLPAAHFWLRPHIGKTFHILSPIQGIIVGLTLMGVYSLMDYCL